MRAGFERHSGHNFGTFAGVFTPSILTILGVIMFMRAGFVVGEAGIGGALFILLIAKSITTLTALSIGAISSNLHVRGGGAYFLISRVLGPEFGGTIGLALFFAQALSVPFYILGFAEALTTSFPFLRPYFQLVALVAAGVLFFLAYLGANWAIRAQYLILTVLFLSIFFFLAGAAGGFRWSLFHSNFWSSYTVREGGGMYTFWSVFAIYFPAVTGILAGVNMSGDLRDPSRSIPLGTLLAVGVGMGIYGLQILLMGGAFSRWDLVERPFEILELNALFGWGWLVLLGMFAASLSSALGSYLGAPRILQAVARDRVLRFLSPFAQGSGRGDEPRLALILTGILTLGTLLWAGNHPRGGSFNLVAAVITMFFLYTYGMINLAAFIEAFAGNPSFRPRFRYFHWGTALLGALGCVVVTFLIDPEAAFVAIVLLGGVLFYLTKCSLGSDYEDARRGFIYTSVRRNLLRLQGMEADSRNWRPFILVFSGNPSSREVLVSYAVWMEARRGMVFLANVLVGEIERFQSHRLTAIRQLEGFCHEKGIQAFPLVMVSPSLESGILHLLQTAGLGPLQPNVVMFGWPAEGSDIEEFCKHLRLTAILKKSILLFRGSGEVVVLRGGQKRVDIWWRGRKNGALMVMLAHLIGRNWEWMNLRVRVLRVVESEAGLAPAEEALRALIEEARIEAEVEVIVSDRPFSEVLRQHSGGASCVFLGLEIPASGEEKVWRDRWEGMLEGFGVDTILVCSSSEEDVLV
ncbi:MAG: amino acid permease [Planctomycetota bacterium]|nr:MAG: amino acid permease [Planctomycetota bacterium]